MNSDSCHTFPRLSAARRHCNSTRRRGAAPSQLYYTGASQHSRCNYYRGGHSAAPQRVVGLPVAPYRLTRGDASCVSLCRHCPSTPCGAHWAAPMGCQKPGARNAPARVNGPIREQCATQALEHTLGLGKRMFKHSRKHRTEAHASLQRMRSAHEALLLDRAV